MASTSASHKVRSSLDAAAAGLTTKVALAQGSDAVNSVARATGAAEAAKGKGIVGKAGKAAGRQMAKTSTGQKVGAVATRAAAAGSGWLSSPAAQMAGKALSIGARAAPWMLAANAIGGAAKGGFQAYEKGGSTLDVAKGAAWGAADQVTVGLASWAYGKGAQVASAIGNAIVPSAQAAEGSVGKKPSSGEAFRTWDRMTAQMESGTMHARVERQYGPMQSAMRKSVEARGGGMVREQQAQAETPSRAKARESFARDELAKQGIKEGTDQYHERMQEMRAGKVPKREKPNVDAVLNRAETDSGIQREAWDTALKGMLDPKHSTPEMQAYAREQMAKPDKGFPSGGLDIERARNAIHEGSGGRSDGMGQVDWDRPAAPGYKDVPRPPGMMKLGGPKPINMRNAESISSGDVNYGNGHTAVQDMYATADRARYDVGMYRRTGLTPDVLHGKSGPSSGPQGSLDPGQTRAFNQASQHYSDSHMTGHADKASPTYGANGDGRRGFQIPKVQAAAQAAKGNNYQGPDE